MAATFSVYALYDPADPAEVRYIGYSCNLRHRLRVHVRDATNPTHHGYKVHWIRLVIAAGRRPELRVLAPAATQIEAGELERDAIYRFRAEGHRLTNATSGGDGVLGFKFTDIHRARMGAAQRQRFSDSAERAKSVTRGREMWSDPERLARQAETTARYYSDPAMRARNARTNRAVMAGLSKEQKAARHAAQVKGFQSAAARARMSAAQQRRYRDPAQREKSRAVAKRLWAEDPLGLAAAIRAGHAKKKARVA